MKFDWFRMFSMVEIFKGEGVAYQKLLQEFIAANILDMTFLEAYKHTSRIINISLSPTDTHQFPRLLNYLTSQNGLIPFIQDAILKVPMVQLEQLLGLVHQHFEIPGLDSIVKKAHAVISQTLDHCLQRMSERFVYVERQP